MTEQCLSPPLNPIVINEENAPLGMRYFALPSTASGFPAEDINGMIGNMTHAYMDIYPTARPGLIPFYMAWGTISLHLLCYFVFFDVFTPLTENDLLYARIIAWVMLPLVLLATIRLVMPTPLPAVRFHRQRQEACIYKGKGSWCFVPWTHILGVGTVHVQNQGPTSAVYVPPKAYNCFGFRLYVTDILTDTPVTPYLFNTFGNSEADILKQWECIRTFMTTEFQTITPRRGKHYWQLSGFKDLYLDIKNKHYISAFLGLFFTLLMGEPVYAFLLNLRNKHQRQFEDAEIKRWSEPL